jgi:hypothetical protein
MTMLLACCANTCDSLAHFPTSARFCALFRQWRFACWPSLDPDSGIPTRIANRDSRWSQEGPRWGEIPSVRDLGIPGVQHVSPVISARIPGSRTAGKTVPGEIKPEPGNTALV